MILAPGQVQGSQIAPTARPARVPSLEPIKDKDMNSQTTAAAPIFNDDDRVMRDKETAARTGLSLKHFRRIRSEGKGPPIVRLGVRAVGDRKSFV